MAETPVTQTVIRRIVRRGHGGHHGGQWKIAYADFVTAMMAFFLLMWLLNAMTEEQMAGISNYFAPASLSENRSGAGGLLGGRVIGPGSLTDNAGSPLVSGALPPPSIGLGGNALTDPPDISAGSDLNDAGTLLARAEQAEFERAAAELDEAIRGVPELDQFGDNLLVDNTVEGLRIQLVDDEGNAMFASGSAQPARHTRVLLEQIAGVIQKLNQRIAITGHTDATPFANGDGYGNWELSADRALAARRLLVGFGLNEARIARVEGRADTDLLDVANPRNPRNRRISVVLLRENAMPGGIGPHGGGDVGSPLPPGFDFRD